MPLPLFKLGALAAKQISKPLAKILKDKAKTHPGLKKYLILPVANTYHSFDITLRMRILGLGSPDKVPPLTENAAIDLGGDILSEFFVFGVAVGLVLLEYYRQSSNKAIKETEAAKKVDLLEEMCVELTQKLDANTKRMTEINKFIADQKTKLDELNNRLNKMDNKSKVRVATQAAQTTNGIQVGKVMYAKNSGKTAASDVTSSVVYQSAQAAVDALKKLKND